MEASANHLSLAEEDHRPFSKQFPADVLRVILEAAADPGDGTFSSLSDKRQLKYVLDLCLLDKRAACWVEPLLYKSVVLETENQVISFSYALKRKSPEFLAYSIRALWILRNCEELNLINFGQLFSTLHRLESLALPGNKHRLLREISTPSSIRNLILIKPRAFIGRAGLRHLSLQSLHIFDSGETFLCRDSANHQDPTELLIQLSAIPRICLDFTRSPCYQPVSYLPGLGRLLSAGERLQAEAQSSSFTLMRDTEEARDVRAEPRSLWVKQSNERGSTSPSYWKFTVDVYTQTAPSNRQACSESPLAKLPEYNEISKLPRLQLIKDMIYYNEVHWDRVAGWCEAERARKEAKRMS